MMSLLRLDNLFLAYGDHALLDHVELQIEKDERVCLIGRNGEGKSSFLKILAGLQKADDGTVWVRDGVKISYLPQDLPPPDDRLVYDVVTEGLGDLSSLLQQYEHTAHQLQGEPENNALLETLESLQHQIEAKDGWLLHQNVSQVIQRLELDPEATMGSLSGGWRRRAMLAKALLQDPDLLLLDEPTNHLDMESIAWLESFLTNHFHGSLLFITHDRRFLSRLATRILELDRGQLTSWPGDYNNYLRRKEERQNAENLENARFEKKLAEEETWIRQGIKARRTRNEGRVRALEKMRDQKAQQRKSQGTASFSIEHAGTSGKIVAEAKGMSFSWPNKTLVSDFDYILEKGDKIALVGPNGCGKSTLINLLMGKLQPVSGNIKTGTQLEIAYFDQARTQIDLEKSVVDNLSQGREYIDIGGKSKHVLGYLQEFLFHPKRARQPAKALSGGELNRLLLAKMFSKAANVLILDEPTNDLDIETLELLESLLVDFPGTVLLVSHDRAFIDNVATSLLVFEGRGKITEYVGGIEDWQTSIANKKSTSQKAKQEDNTPEKAKAKQGKKLSYKDQRELDSLPETAEKLEEEIDLLEEKISQPDFYQGDDKTVKQTLSQLEEKQALLSHSYERWEALEALQDELAG